MHNVFTLIYRPKGTHLFLIGKIFFQIPKSADGETRTWQNKKAEYKKSSTLIQKY